MVPDNLEGACPNIQSELFEGCTVHYVAYNGRCLTGIVIGHDDATKVADLVVFTNMSNVNGVKNFGMQFHQDISFNKEPKPGTWHWVA